MMLPAVSSASSPDNAKIKGLVQSVSEKEITVKGTVVKLAKGTVIVNGSREDLVVGAPVRIKVVQSGDDLYAVWIACHDDSFELEGYITDMPEESIVVGGKRVYITGKTKYQNCTHTELKIGMKVQIKGKDDGQYLIALSVRVLWGDNDDQGLGQPQHVKGNITNLRWVDNYAYFTLDDELTLSAKADQKVYGRHGIHADASCLMEGLMLYVRYRAYVTTTDATEMGEAQKIVVLNKASVAGEIGIVSDACTYPATIYVDGNAVICDKFTRLLGPANDPLELAEGTGVKVLCNEIADGSYLGNKIIVHGYNDRPDDPVKIKGEVTAVTRENGVVTGFTVDEEVFVVDEKTTFNVKGYPGPLPDDEFLVGLTVFAKGIPDDNDDLVADWVRIYLPTNIFCGEITALGDSTITLLSKTATVNEWTRFDDFELEGFGFDDLIVGDKVKVKTVLFPGGALIASEVEPCDSLSVMVLGEIESMETTAEGLLLSVSGVAVKTTAETVIKTRPSTDLQVGDYVFVKGALDEFGVLVAELVKAK